MNRASSIVCRSLALAVAMALAGCHKKVPPARAAATAAAAAGRAAAAATATAAAAAAGAAPPPPRPLTEEEIFARKTLEQLNAEHPLDDVYFDLDKSDDSRRRAAGAAEGRRLAEEVDEHADHHRGPLRLARQRRSTTSALGSRRATAVKDYLVSLGVPPAA